MKAIKEKFAAACNATVEAVVEVAEKVKKHAIALGVGALALGHTTAAKALDIVSYDSATDEVTFSPENITAPVVTGIVAAVSAGAIIMVISIGVRWIWRMLKTR